jgi:hypothetical protein
MRSPTRASRLMENPEVLTLFNLAGPDYTRCIEEFEAVLDTHQALLIMKRQELCKPGFVLMFWPLLKLLSSWLSSSTVAMSS